jgi:hypothetical protein
MTRVGQIFPHTNLCTNFDQKMVGATFWVIFSQTHRVTLATNKNRMTW